MRDNLIKTFDTNPNADQGYTYAELIHLRGAGRDVPDKWLTDAYDREAKRDAVAERDKAIADEIQAATEAHAAAEAARLEEAHATLAEMLPKLEEAKDAARDTLQPLREATAAHNAAHQAAMVEYQKIRGFVADNFDRQVEADTDGNAVPGQTIAPRESHRGLSGQSFYVEGEEFRMPYARDNYA
ncbi:hypothetical protein PQI66_04405 [Corynebacterium sp. USCH3]|uniref:hypothetical protein n=1 Tax=Corynebacterium sp. USCH3 TaxID=3024840 RepID=UPI0030A40897